MLLRLGASGVWWVLLLGGRQTNNTAPGQGQYFTYLLMWWGYGVLS